MDKKTKSIQLQLQNVQRWAKKKLQGGSEPPWAWYQYMKLVETVDAILSSMDSVNPMGNSQQLGEHQDSDLRLVDSTDPQDASQHHQDFEKPRMPM